MRRKRWSSVARLSAPALVAICTAGQAFATDHVVAIEDMVFRPAVVHVAPGDRITWINKDLVPHTVTAADRSFDSGRIDPGQSWSLEAGTSGHGSYVCTYHPSMQGSVELQ